MCIVQSKRRIGEWNGIWLYLSVFSWICGCGKGKKRRNNWPWRKCDFWCCLWQNWQFRQRAHLCVGKRQVEFYEYYRITSYNVCYTKLLRDLKDLHKITVMILSDSGKKLKFINAVLIAGLLVSCAFGIWHFFIPYQFRWYSYIPSAPKEIIVSVDWINFFFSLFLTGNSLMLLLFYKRIIEKEIVCFSFYGFLTFRNNFV